MTYTTLCTEGMVHAALMFPVEMAPGHLVDSRDIQGAILRMQAAMESANRQPEQMRLFA
jgi:hypothetical protein